MPTNVKLEQFKESLFQSLSDNEIPDAITKLREVYHSADTRYYDELILLSRQYKDLSDRQLSGLIDDQTANIEKNRITHGLIKIVSTIQDDAVGAAYFGLAPPPGRLGTGQKTSTAAGWKRAPVIGLLLISLIALGAVVFWQRSKEIPEDSVDETAVVAPAPKQQEQESIGQTDRDTAEPATKTSTLPTPVTFAKSAHSSLESAKTLSFNQPIQATLLSKEDEHYYLFTATEDRNLNLILSNQSNSFKPSITLYDMSRKSIPRLFKTSSKAVGQGIEKLYTGLPGHQYQIVISGQGLKTFGAYGLLITYPE